MLSLLPHFPLQDIVVLRAPPKMIGSEEERKRRAEARRLDSEGCPGVRMNTNDHQRITL